MSFTHWPSVDFELPLFEDLNNWSVDCLSHDQNLVIEAAKRLSSCTWSVTRSSPSSTLPRFDFKFGLLFGLRLDQATVGLIPSLAPLTPLLSGLTLRRWPVSDGVIEEILSLMSAPPVSASPMSLTFDFCELQESAWQHLRQHADRFPFASLNLCRYIGAHQTSPELLLDFLSMAHPSLVKVYIDGLFLEDEAPMKHVEDELPAWRSNLGLERLDLKIGYVWSTEALLNTLEYGDPSEYGGIHGGN